MLGAVGSAGRGGGPPASMTRTVPASGCDPELDPEPEPEPEVDPDPELDVSPPPEPVEPEVDPVPPPPVLDPEPPSESSPRSTGPVFLLAHPTPGKQSPATKRRDQEALNRRRMKALLTRTRHGTPKDNLSRLGQPSEVRARDGPQKRVHPYAGAAMSFEPCAS